MVERYLKIRGLLTLISFSLVLNACQYEEPKTEGNIGATSLNEATALRSAKRTRGSGSESKIPNPPPTPAPNFSVQIDGSTVKSLQLARIHFDDIVEGSGNSVKTLKITSTGTATLNLTPAIMPAGFEIQPNLPSSLAPGQSFEASIFLDDAVAGSYTGEMTFYSNHNDDGVFTLNLEGRVLENTPADDCVSSTNQFQNFPINGITSNNYKVDFDVLATADSRDALIMMSAASGSTYRDYAASVRFNHVENGVPNLIVDALNASAYSAQNNFTFGPRTHVRVEVNGSTQTYSVYVANPGNPEIRIAQNFAFRTLAPSAARLSNLGIHAASGSHQVCNLEVAELSADNAPTVPAAPSTLSATLAGANVTLAWMDNSNNETGFKITRVKTGGGSIEWSVGANTSSAIDNNPGAGTFTYSVKATNSAGDSTASNPASVTIQEQTTPPSTVGWTVFTPSADTKKIYVSLAGGGNGLSQSSPTSLQNGISLMEDGHPDWLLLKRGETYPPITGWNKSGRSASEKMMIGSWGSMSDSRPVLKSTDDRSAFGVRFAYALKNFALVDIRLEASQLADFGLEMSISGVPADDTNGSNILIEGVEVFGAKTNGIQWQNGRRIKNFSIRRSVFRNSDGYSHSQGLLIAGVDNLLIEENLFDSNSPGATSDRAQGLYLHQTCGPAISRANIFSRNGHIGLQARSGGTVEFNLGIDNAISFEFGNNETSLNEEGNIPYHASGTMRYNVATQGHHVIQRVLAHGFWISNASSVTADENIAAHRGILTGYAEVIRVDKSEDVSLTNSIGYKWFSTLNATPASIYSSTNVTQSNMDFRYVNPSVTGAPYPDANRSIDTYAQSVGLANRDAFLARAIANDKSNWDPRFTAREVVKYFRSGFGRPTPDE